MFVIIIFTIELDLKNQKYLLLDGNPNFPRVHHLFRNYSKTIIGFSSNCRKISKLISRYFHGHFMVNRYLDQLPNNIDIIINNISCPLQEFNNHCANQQQTRLLLHYRRRIHSQVICAPWAISNTMLFARTYEYDNIIFN